MPPILFLMRNMPIQVTRSARQLGSPRLIQGAQPLRSAPPITITGITRDSTGAVLGGCIVQVFETATDHLIAEVTSDPITGVYVVFVGIGTGPYYVVAYLAGAPDVAGTSVNSLVGA